MSDHTCTADCPRDLKSYRAGCRTTEAKAANTAYNKALTAKRRAADPTWYPGKGQHQVICASTECGKTFAATTKRTIHCSKACGTKAGNRKRGYTPFSKRCTQCPTLIPTERRTCDSARCMRRHMATQKLEAAANGTAGTRMWACGHCTWCKELFCIKGGGTGAKAPIYCSTRCVRKGMKKRREMRMRDAYVEDVSPTRVFEVDGYRCYLCLRMTDQTKGVPHPLAPTIDHVIPIAKGGKHAYLNCRCACFECNWTKRDTMPDLITDDRIVMQTAEWNGAAA